MGDFNEDRAHQVIEQKSVTFREMVERAYAAAPKATASELTYMGYWSIAAQLKIDHQSGKL